MFFKLVGALILGLPRAAPVGAVVHDPVGQGVFEAHVASGFLGLDPFMFQNLLALSLEFPVKRGILQQILRGRSGFFA